MTSLFAVLIVCLSLSIFHRSQIERILPSININKRKRHGEKQWIEFHKGDKFLVIFNVELKTDGIALKTIQVQFKTFRFIFLS